MNIKRSNEALLRFLIIPIFLLVVGCNPKASKPQISDKVILKSNNLNKEWITFSYFGGIDSKTKTFQFDSTGTITLDMNKIETPFVQISYKGNSRDVFLTNGDTITMDVNLSKDIDTIKFKGKYPSNYNFFDGLRVFYKNFPKYSGDINEYKNLCEQFYNSKKTFFENYCETNNCPNDFKKWVLNELISDYYAQMIAPISGEKIMLNDVPSDYFKNIDINSFANLDLRSRKSTYAISQFVRYYFTKPSLKFSEQERNEQLSFINDNFEGTLKEFALADLYNINIINLLPSNIEDLKSNMAKSKKQMKSEIYRSKISEFEDLLNRLNTKIPDSILNVKLTSLKDEALDINDLLNRNKGKIIVFDIWAHWCYWCIYDMEEAKEFKNNLINQETVEWIYLSIDRAKYKSQWIAKSEEKKELGLLKNQFLIDENDYPKFSAFADLESTGIPKYIVFDQNSNLALLNGPRPTDSLFFKRALNGLYH